VKGSGGGRGRRTAWGVHGAQVKRNEELPDCSLREGKKRGGGTLLSISWKESGIGEVGVAAARGKRILETHLLSFQDEKKREG